MIYLRYACFFCTYFFILEKQRGSTCAMVHMWRPKDYFQELLLSFLCVSSRVLVSGHLYSSNCLYLLSHLIYHLFSFKISIYSHKIPSWDSFYFIQWIVLRCSYTIFLFLFLCVSTCGYMPKCECVHKG